MTKGTMTRTYTVWCASCDAWGYCEGNTVKEASQEARLSGWVKTKKAGWLCHACYYSQSLDPRSTR